MELPKKYSFEESEKKWAEYWKKKKVYRYDEKSEKPVFSIDTPPPTVSGKMHIGHAFSYAQGDIVARYHRMAGKNLFYPYGTDDNGLATERLVEKLKKVNSKSMKRDEFRDLCMKTLEEIKPDFTSDWVKIGVSADFEGSYSTIDNHCIKTSQKSFLDLYKKGHVYTEESPVSWCVHCQTAIAQAEFENVDMTSHFNNVIFKQGSKELVIATTRLELLPACVALFAHPDDERYKDLKGKFARVPLFDYEVPILYDENVDMEKGTGLMMVCTFGDKDDVFKWHKYKLPLKTAITIQGKMNDEAKGYEGLPIKEARKKISEDLERQGLLVSKKDITHAVNVHERCGTEIEILKTKQWFIRVLDKKQELIGAAEKIKWHPEFMKKRYVHWVENLQWDWCISRQRHFGVPFPVWYSKKTGEIILADEDQLPVDPLSDKPKTLPKGHTYEDIIPEEDVMDTWNTSSLTPQIALGWAENDSKYKKVYPMSVRMQAHDIIRTWAFYTIVKGLYNSNDIPWKNIMVSGFVLDPKGDKMSKSKGNIIMPQEVIGKYGADGLRYWAAGSKLGEDMSFQEKDVVTGKKTVTKIWNASKFTIMNLKDYNAKPLKELELKDLRVMDKWIVSKVMRAVKNATESFESYEYSRSMRETDVLFWHKFCDNYLEFVKHRTYEAKDEKSKLAAQKTLYYSLLSILKMFAPVMPFITEEVYQVYFKGVEGFESIHVSDWPSFNKKLLFEKEEKAGDLAVRVVSDIRKHKSEKGLSLKTELGRVEVSCSDEDKKLLELVVEDVKAVGNVKEFVFSKGKELTTKIN